MASQFEKTNPFEKTVSATEFKAKCLDLMEQIHTRKLDRLHVTKRGKPFVSVICEPAAAAPLPSIFGCMQDWPRPVPVDHDWEKPLYSDAELDGFIADTSDQIDALGRRPRE